MAELFGDLERLAADLYPYRWPILAVILIVIAGVVTFGYKRGWHLWVSIHRVPVVVVGAPLLVVAGFVAWELGSPIFINVTVEEEFPFAYGASLPEGVDMKAAEMVMSTMAKVEQAPMKEPMPEEMMAPKAAAAATPTPMAPQTQATAAAGPVKVKSGSFQDQDAFHKGSGEAVIYRAPDGAHLLRLEELQVTNGPDLRVILTPVQAPGGRDDVMARGSVELGKLKGNRGSQNYTIPADVDVAAQGSVVIYCKPFSVIFSIAQLEDAG